MAGQAQLIGENNVAGLPARRLAVDLLEGVLHRHQALETLLPKLDEVELTREDRAFTMALTLASLRHYGSLRTLASARLARPLPMHARRAEIILILALVQIVVLKTPAHAVVSLAVGLAKENSATLPYASLINAVLRRLSEDKALKLDAKENLPAWLFARWQKNYGEETALAMVCAQLAEPPLDLSIKADPEIWVKKLGGEILPTGTLRLFDHKGGIINLPGFAEGVWWVQDAGALLSVLACGDVKGKTVLDLCAAPGGKTAALCARDAKVTALDRSKPRLELLRQNLQRLKFDAEIICADATKWTADKLYDVILLDAPCSSTGTLRRRPDVAWIKAERDIEKLAALQEKLLHRASGWLKPGGILVYSVCSLELEEGESQAQHFLAAQSQFSMCPVLASKIGGPDEFITPQGNLRTRPDMLVKKGGIDGFFVAKFVKAKAQP